jgi:hypothetical protein
MRSVVPPSGLLNYIAIGLLAYDFEIRKALAWKACIRLVKIWKSNSISAVVKIKLFRACVESTLLYDNAVTWTLTDTPLSRKLPRWLLDKAVTLRIKLQME